MVNKENLKKLLASEGGFTLSDQVLNKFLSLGVPISLPPKKFFIEPHSKDQSIWITVEGVTKVVYFNGKKEIVIGFGGPATISMSPSAIAIGKPGFCGFQTITDCEMLRINKADFDSLMMESHEFARWMFGILITQLFLLELKIKTLSEGDIYSKYKKLMNSMMTLESGNLDAGRPQLLNIISSKDLASYLGITQSYLSNIRKSIYDNDKNEN